MFSIDAILKATGGRLWSGDKEKRVSGISIDSRTIEKSELFIAIKGERFDGHHFIQEAIKKGASGVIVAHPPKEISSLKVVGRRRIIIEVRDTIKALGDIAAYHRRRFNIPVIGITGSNGKTTVKEMVWHILSRSYKVLKTSGTENNLVGLPLTLLGLRKVDSIAVLEMGASHLGQIGRLTQILKPTIGLITNIGPSHLEFLKDRRGVLKAKSEMVGKLGAKDLVILNGDDTMLSRLKVKQKKIRFGLKRRNDFRATDIKSNGRIHFLLNKVHPLSINLLGEHNLYNALAAIAVSSYLGVSISLTRDALLNFKLPSMRMELREINGIKIINDAYNSNPLSLKWAIRTLSDIKAKGKKILVSGDMLELGKKDIFFHRLVGRIVADSSIDTLITVGELSRHTIASAKRAGMDRHSLWPCSDPCEAADILKGIAKRGDTVLIKGSRAMNMERILNH